MPFIHGRGATVSLGGTDLSAFSNSINFNRSADSHDTTCFGKLFHVFAGGLGNGEATLSGIYDDAGTGPRAIIEPLIGTTVVLVYRPEGAGTGKPGDTVNVVVTAYEETVPVADMISWSATLQMSDSVVTADQ